MCFPWKNCYKSLKSEVRLFAAAFPRFLLKFWISISPELDTLAPQYYNFSSRACRWSLTFIHNSVKPHLHAREEKVGILRCQGVKCNVFCLGKEGFGSFFVKCLFTVLNRDRKDSMVIFCVKIQGKWIRIREDFVTSQRHSLPGLYPVSKMGDITFYFQYENNQATWDRRTELAKSSKPVWIGWYW